MQGPADGTIVFTDGTGAVLAQGAATACGNCQIGLTVTFSAQGGTYGIGYGPHSGECFSCIVFQADHKALDISLLGGAKQKKIPPPGVIDPGMTMAFPRLSPSGQGLHHQD